jgi:PAS domain S-box-containing protein
MCKLSVGWRFNDGLVEEERMQPARILIVDDQEGARRALRSLLSSCVNLSVCGEACDGLDAVAKAKALRPDVILMDVSMPRMNGIDATRAIAEEVPESDIILVSQNEPAVIRQQAAGSAARGHVSKGDISELLPTIERLLDIRKERYSSQFEMAKMPPPSSRERSTQEQQAMGLLAAIVGSSDDAIISKNLDGTITSWNSSAERLFGYTFQEAIGRNITLIIPPERLDEEASILERIRRGERVDHFETVRVRKDGTKLDVSLTISPIKDAAGRILGASKIARDITQRKRNEEALEEQARLLDLSRDAILVRSVHDEIRFWNQGAAELYGYSREEALGRISHEFLCTCFPEPLQQITAKLHREGYWTGDLVHTRKDGGRIVVVSRWQANRDANGQVETILETNNDVTRQKQSEEQLRESERRLREFAGRLEQQVRARTEELERRNAEALEQSERLRDLSNRLLKTQDEERRRLARELHDSAGQIVAALAMGLSNMARQAKQDPPLEKALEENQELLQQLNKEIRTMSYLLHPPLLDENGLSSALSWYITGLKERSGLDIELDVLEGFGRLSTEMELALFRIVQECLTNIHRHSGSKTACVRISRSADDVRLDVVDNGTGINADKLAAIQARRSGVGLTGIHERVRQLHGVTNIQSNSNGTLVSVILPIPSSDSADTPEKVSVDTAARIPRTT